MKKTFNLLITFFLSGLLLLLPIGFSIYVIVRVFFFIDDLIPQYKPLLPYYFPGVGFIVVIALVTIIGFIFTKIIRFPIAEYIDQNIEKIPVISMLYSSSRDLMKAFVGEEKRFNKPVRITVNSKEEIYKLGFITDTTLKEINIEEGYSAVYCPHSFNFSGELFIFKNTALKPLDINSSNLMKYIVSGGITELMEDNVPNKIL